MSVPGSILARGPWAAHQIDARWSDEPFAPSPEHAAAADRAIAELRARSSPSHDGVAARLVRWADDDGRLVLDLQPMRWSLRLVEGDASQSLSAICLVRDPDGRWLAGRRAPWLASWPGSWALGAAGAVDASEHPFATFERELREEWGVASTAVRGELLLMLPHRMALLVGHATVPADAAITPDDEHDAWTWWPAEIADWPDEAGRWLRDLATAATAAAERTS